MGTGKRRRRMMKGYQIAIICLLSVNLAVSLIKHGEEKPDYNFWSSLVSTAISVWLYIKAGLFN